MSLLHHLTGLLIETQNLTSNFENGFLRDIHPADLQLSYDVMLSGQELLELRGGGRCLEDKVSEVHELLGH